jgi:undecaprenyl-diphosphatase
MINNFDRGILEFFNLSSSSHFLFVKAAFIISANDLLKGMFVTTVLWWAWLKDTGKLINKDLYSLRTIVGALIAVFLGRLVQNLSPMRLRPIHNPDIDFRIVHDIFRSPLEGWSSFPSDHAVLFFALSTAIFAKSRLVGIFVFSWSFFVICLPRIYLGVHYPTDIIAGAIMGIVIMYIVLKVPFPHDTWKILRKFENTYSSILFAMVFLISVQIATLFDSVRELAIGGIEILSIVLRT